MVVHAAQYPWSSHCARIGEVELPWLDLEEAYLALGATPAECRQRYRQFVSQEASPLETGLIRQGVSRNPLIGNAAFIDEIELRLGVRIEHRGRGRPENKFVPIYL